MGIVGMVVVGADGAAVTVPGPIADIINNMENFPIDTRVRINLISKWNL
jgi:hypothetical protein